MALSIRSPTEIFHLITMVQKYPLLWNTSHAEYNSPIGKVHAEMAWYAVCDATGLSLEDVMLTWKALRRHHQKVIQRSRSKNPRPIIWRYFNALNFLEYRESNQNSTPIHQSSSTLSNKNPTACAQRPGYDKETQDSGNQSNLHPKHIMRSVVNSRLNNETSNQTRFHSQTEKNSAPVTDSSTPNYSTTTPINHCHMDSHSTSINQNHEIIEIDIKPDTYTDYLDSNRSLLVPSDMPSQLTHSKRNNSKTRVDKNAQLTSTGANPSQSVTPLTNESSRIHITTHSKPNNSKTRVDKNAQLTSNEANPSQSVTPLTNASLRIQPTVANVNTEGTTVSHKITQPRSDSDHSKSKQLVESQNDSDISNAMNSPSLDCSAILTNQPRDENNYDEIIIIDDDPSPERASETPSVAISPPPALLPPRLSLCPAMRSSMQLDDVKYEADDLLFFQSLMPYMERLTHLQKLRVRRRFTEKLIQEIETHL